MKTIKFGIIGIGLMGREFASAVMRWPHLIDMDIKPEIVAICGNPLTPGEIAWYKNGLSTLTQITEDYKELLANPEVEAVYCAVPHFLHERFYIDIIQSGKHLLGEKPFGIDLQANNAIMEAIEQNPDVFVRCSSEFPFAPAMQRLCEMLERDEFGRIIEVEAGFLHSSDMDVNKPINWKRIIKANGEYGCMGDLGIHVCHVPFRAGWMPKSVRAVLSNLVPERPDGKGGMAVCETWDNAVLLCESEDAGGNSFPLTLKTQRIAPGEKNTWYLTIKGMKGSARFSTKNINSLEYLRYTDGEQAWCREDMGHETAFKSITGGIFETGFSDTILQMWAAFMYELVQGEPKKKFAGCVTPEEARDSHFLFTAALDSYKQGSVKQIAVQ
ncbi:MAG: Gfo/Idh/MocA family oxidoreductase [Spirochaetales bacterium]|nr:Gfo/Idh/MocA family oxidoreductase [Spirochaetales bacterium]